jgi:AcrR family transcriptional regulator
MAIIVSLLRAGKSDCGVVSSRLVTTMRSDIELLRGEGPGEDAEGLTARLLDAALAEFTAYGLRRTSMENVAERAGLARSTLYRRFSNKQDLVRAVALRQVRELLVHLVRQVEALPTVEERLVEAFVIGVQRSRADGLLGRLLESEPETVLPYFTTHADVGLGLGRAFLAEQLRRSPGPAVAADPDAAAEVIFRLTSSIMLSPRAYIPLDTDDELRAFARAYLVPLLHQPGLPRP